MDIVAIGELLIDFCEVDTDDEGYPTLQAQPGGAPANVLAAAALCGRTTAMIGKVGDDVFGRQLVTSLTRRGVDCHGIVFDPDVYTTLAFVTLDTDGERTFSFARKPGADTCLRVEELSQDLLNATRILHFGSLSLTDEPSRTTAMRAVQQAHDQGALISFDPNWRPALWSDTAAARAAMTWGFTHSDLVKLSDEDAAFYWDCAPDEVSTLAHQLLDEFGCQLVFCTRGARGCCAITPMSAAEITVPVAVVPVDTTGAGDAFTGAALAGLLEYGGDPLTLTSENLAVIATRACEFASLSTTHRGGFPPLA